MKKSLNLIIFLALNIFVMPMIVLAADFRVGITREYTVNEVSKVHVVETHVINNQHKKDWISDTNKEYFFISTTTGDSEALAQTLATVTLTIDGVATNVAKDLVGEYGSLSVKLPKPIKPGETMTLKLEYDNFGLIEKKGALIDFYAPGFKADTTNNIENKTTTYSYDTYVNISKSLPEINFVTPSQHTKETLETTYRYHFSYENLLDKYIWIQIGIKQYYKFEIKQIITPSENTKSTYENEYRLIVPRDVDEPGMYQKVYFTNINPLPAYAEKDKDGNLILIYKFATNTSTEVVVEGYAEIGRPDGEIDYSNSGQIDDSNLSGLSEYLLPDQYASGGQIEDSIYWQVNDLTIESKVQEIVGDEKNINQISTKLYDYIISQIDYSKVKRFGLNERQGALKTLSGSAAVCMEYSDLFLTLARSAKVPTRAVFGYGYDSKLQNDQQEAHQWVEVFMPGLGKWVSIDVTWGESGIDMTEGNLNHFTTHMASVNPDTPSVVERKTYGSNTTLEKPRYTIEAVENILRSENPIREQKDVLNEFRQVQGIANVLSFNLNFQDFIKSINLSSIMIISGVILMFVSIAGIIKMIKSNDETLA